MTEISDMTQALGSTMTRYGKASEDNPGPEPPRVVTVTWESELISCGFPRSIALKSLVPLDGMPEFDAVKALAASHIPATVYAWGANGNGKTHMASYLASMIHARAMTRYVTDRAASFPPRLVWASCNAITAAMRNFSKGHFDYDRELRTYTSPDLLLIDDLWPDRATEMDVANIVEIVEIRRNMTRPTIITGNHGARALVAHSRRFADRLGEGAVIHFTGKSHRTQKENPK